MKANSSKSTHFTFTTRRATCPGVHIYNEQLPQAEEAKYLGLHLDGSLTWHKHIFAKRKYLGITLSKIYWLMGRKSKLSISNKLPAYKVIIKSIWSYGIQLWGSASISKIEILEIERFQGKFLRMITDAPWYMSKMVLRQDLQIISVKEEIHRFGTQYKDRLYTHPNNLTIHLTVPLGHRRMRRHLPIDLATRFNV
jgi:hypothetical protein